MKPNRPRIPGNAIVRPIENRTVGRMMIHSGARSGLPPGTKPATPAPNILDLLRRFTR